MYDSMLEEKWIIWNSSLGIRDFVTIDRVELFIQITEARDALLECLA